MTEHMSHRDEAGIQLSVAREDPESDPIGLGILHGILALHDLIAEAVAEDAWDLVEADQSERFSRGGAVPASVDSADEDTVETPTFYGVAYVPDADVLARNGLTPNGLPTAEVLNRPFDWDVIRGNGGAA